MSRTHYYWDAASLKHDTGRHVEQIARAERLAPAAMSRLVAGLDARPPAAHDVLHWILQVHAVDYHDWVKRACAAGPRLLDQGDTVVGPGSYEAALASVNAVLTAVDAVVAGEADNAFCAVRPPGHHALPDAAMGFCIFANISIGARYLQRRHGIGRIAIVDWDVHHGNGTQHIFYADPTVLFVSLHQHPHWPGTGMSAERGNGPGSGFTLNIPLPSGTDDSTYLAAFRAEVVPALRAFAPEFVLVSAGFDAHRDDPIANLRLTEAGFAEMTRTLKQLAGELCGGRIVSVLEGGYNLDALQTCVAAHVTALVE